VSSLRPVAGSTRELLGLLEGWLAGGGEPVVVQTSGSAGEPKGVLLSHRAITSSATATLDRLGGPGQWLLTLPSHYIAGLQVLVRSLLAGSTPVLLDDHGSLSQAVDAMTGERRYTAVVPTQLFRWLEAAPAALRGFDAVLVGGAAAAPALLDRARAAGVRVVTTYGSSETAGGCIYDGYPLDGVSVALSPRGRIRIAGPVLFDGYLDRPALTAQALVDGWLVTGDVGAMEADGRLTVLGRSDDVVISGGQNVALPAVAARIAHHPAVADAAALGLADPEWGTRVVAVVVGTVGLEELRDFVAEELPRSWAPRELLDVPALPLLSNGKLDRRALRRLFADR
jgi:O-succinylbenzoic acid--CoA ligase